MNLLILGKLFAIFIYSEIFFLCRPVQLDTRQETQSPNFIAKLGKELFFNCRLTKIVQRWSPKNIFTTKARTRIEKAHIYILYIYI